jgi:hypothetical protein
MFLYFSGVQSLQSTTQVSYFQGEKVEEQFSFNDTQVKAILNVIKPFDSYFLPFPHQPMGLTMKSNRL